MSSRLPGIALLIVAGGLSACFSELRRGLTFPWDENMEVHAAPRPQARALRPPPGSLTRDGEIAQPRDQSDGLVNPVPRSAAALAGGQQLFTTYCAVCHGADARGEGPITAKFIPAPNLTDPELQAKSDGHFYATIRDGGLVMPAYGEALSHGERWQIVLFLRGLRQP